MHHGSRLTVGEAVLRLRLFAGLETERHPVLYDDAPQPYPLEQPPADWQQPPDAYQPMPISWQDGGAYPPVTDDWQTQAPWPEEAEEESSWLPPEPPFPPQAPEDSAAPRQRHPRSGRRQNHEA